jgi:hypothetical protein
MSSALLLPIGSVIAIVWGIAHLVPTQGVVAGFGQLSSDNRRILTMEWVGEGLTLVFLGVLPLLVKAGASPSDPVPAIVYRSAAIMLLILAAWTALTGSRTSVLPIKLCPVVKTVAATLMLVGSLT